jgi:hypothetical protein
MILIKVSNYKTSQNKLFNLTINVNIGMFKFKFEKQTKGENFDGLDLLTKLLTPNNSNSSKTTAPLIQEISTETCMYYFFFFIYLT